LPLVSGQNQKVRKMRVKTQLHFKLGAKSPKTPIQKHKIPCEGASSLVGRALKGPNRLGFYLLWLYRSRIKIYTNRQGLPLLTSIIKIFHMKSF
jgi:hypothetical protein